MSTKKSHVSKNTDSENISCFNENENNNSKPFIQEYKFFGDENKNMKNIDDSRSYVTDNQSKNKILSLKIKNYCHDDFNIKLRCKDKLLGRNLKR